MGINGRSAEQILSSVSFLKQEAMIYLYKLVICFSVVLDEKIPWNESVLVVTDSIKFFFLKLHQ